MKYSRYPLLSSASAQEDIICSVSSHISQCGWCGCSVGDGTHKVGEKGQCDPFGPDRGGKDFCRPSMILVAVSGRVVAGCEIFPNDLPDKRRGINPLIEDNVHEYEEDTRCIATLVIGP